MDNNFLKGCKKLKINNSKLYPYNKVLKSILTKFEDFKIKGDNGIIGVIGGSIEYTGAPYYAGISALKSGSDLIHIFCHTDAAIPIKCYSPELMVHPAFDTIDNKVLLDKTVRWFKSMDSLIIGPGLGALPETSKIFKYFLDASLKFKSNQILFIAL